MVGWRAMPVFQRYRDPAKRAIYYARMEAVHRNQDVITPRDLLMGLTWDADTRADRIAALKRRACLLRGTSNLPYLPSTATPYKTERKIPLSREGKFVLAYAAEEADHAGDYWIDTDHLLRGLMRVSSDATEALALLGMSLDEMRVASDGDRLSTPAPPVGLVRSALEWWSRYRAWVLFAIMIGGLILLLKLRAPV